MNSRRSTHLWRFLSIVLVLATLALSVGVAGGPNRAAEAATNTPVAGSDAIAATPDTPATPEAKASPDPIAPETRRLAAAAPTPVVYRLPFPAGVSALVTQGNAGLFTHLRRRLSEFAWDFMLPRGSMVVAAAEGTVVDVEDGYSGGGTSDAYLSRSNHVVLAHGDGRYSVYQHLAHRGSLVRPGRHVLAGQGIALSGDTGYTTGPHLHFQLQDGPLVGGSQSVPLTFADAGVPAYGQSPTSANAYRPPPPAPRALGTGLESTVPTAALGSDVYTHQQLPLSVNWVGSGAVRLVTAQADGSRTVAAKATAAPGGEAASPGGLSVRTAATVPGPLTIWAEYRAGDSWSVLGTDAGRLVTLTLTAQEHSLFLADPGVTLAPEAPPTGVGAGSPPPGADPPPAPGAPDGAEPQPAPGDSRTVSFTIVNLGAEPVRLRNLTLEVSPPAGGPDPSAPASLKTVYLRPGQSYGWSDTIVFPAPGRYILAPYVEDAAGRRAALPPTVWGGPAEATVSVGSSSPPQPPSPRQTFVDVPPGHPAYEAVEALAGRGLITGYPSPGGAYEFRPEQGVVRAQFAKLVVGASGFPVSEEDVCTFVDVEVSGPGNLYPDNYIAVAAARGITRGTALDPPRFSPYAPLTRGQGVTMVNRAAGGGGASPPDDPWQPASRADVAVWAAELLTTR